MPNYTNLTPTEQELASERLSQMEKAHQDLYGVSAHEALQGKEPDPQQREFDPKYDSNLLHVADLIENTGKIPGGFFEKVPDVGPNTALGLELLLADHTAASIRTTIEQMSDRGHFENKRITAREHYSFGQDFQTVLGQASIQNGDLIFASERHAFEFADVLRHLDKSTIDMKFKDHIAQQLLGENVITFSKEEMYKPIDPKLLEQAKKDGKEPPKAEYITNPKDILSLLSEALDKALEEAKKKTPYQLRPDYQLHIEESLRNDHYENDLTNNLELSNDKWLGVIELPKNFSYSDNKEEVATLKAAFGGMVAAVTEAGDERIPAEIEVSPDRKVLMLAFNDETPPEQQIQERFNKLTSEQKQVLGHTLYPEVKQEVAQRIENVQVTKEQEALYKQDIYKVNVFGGRARYEGETTSIVRVVAKNREGKTSTIDLQGVSLERIDGKRTVVDLEGDGHFIRMGDKKVDIVGMEAKELQKLLETGFDRGLITIEKDPETRKSRIAQTSSAEVASLFKEETASAKDIYEKEGVTNDPYSKILPKDAIPEAFHKIQRDEINEIKGLEDALKTPSNTPTNKNKPKEPQLTS